MRKFAHIINPVPGGKSSGLHFAQTVTIETMKIAREFAHGLVDVALLTAQYPEDRSLIPEGFQLTPDLNRSVLDFGTFQKERKLPLLTDILDRLYEATDAEYLIFSNNDTALMPHFYVALNALIEAGKDTFAINRRTISSAYQSLAKIPLMYAELGRKQDEHGCFVFRKDAYPRYKLGQVCIGMPPVDHVLIWNQVCQAKKFKELKKKHLTFHLSGEQGGREDGYSDYLAHNKKEASNVMMALEREHSQFGEDGPFSLYPIDSDLMSDEVEV